MREIKFRAWEKEQNIMLYSDEKLPWDVWFSLNNGIVQCFINYTYCDSFSDDYDDWQPLDNIMQYTGLKDKNGKEIYEEDIVNCLECECCGYICWNESEAGFYFNVLLEDGAYEEEHLYDYIDAMEVIGNIYENPELLEVEQ